MSEPILGGFQEVGAAVLTDGEGAFTLTDLWRGRYDVEVSAGAGKASASALEAGDTPVMIVVDAHGR